MVQSATNNVMLGLRLLTRTPTPLPRSSTRYGWARSARSLRACGSSEGLDREWSERVVVGDADPYYPAGRMCR
ncbi:MAG: hypothetical protein ACXVHB_25255 [Solirubrobacteraceae bacterium]